MRREVETVRFIGRAVVSSTFLHGARIEYANEGREAVIG